MGKFLQKFKNGIEKVDEKLMKVGKDNSTNNDNKNKFTDYDSEGFDDINSGIYNEVSIQPSQKPESFHHFILENQYKDLERSIRGFKDIYDKDTREWKIVRKQEHCFTDEEAEEILRTAQSHLATDIKLGFINKDVFGEFMQTIYDELEFLFESIAEYRYGRYGSYEKQAEMKLQNHKIFLELFTRIQANYSRSIQGQENKYTHDSVKGQESLQNRGDLGMMGFQNRRYM